MGFRVRLRWAPGTDDPAVDYGVISDDQVIDGSHLKITVWLAAGRRSRLIVRASCRSRSSWTVHSLAWDRETILKLDAIIHDALEHQLGETLPQAMATDKRSLVGRVRRRLSSEWWTGPVAVDYGPIVSSIGGRLSVLLADRGERRLWLKQSYWAIGFPPRFGIGLWLVPLDHAATEKLDAILHDVLRGWRD